MSARRALLLGLLGPLVLGLAGSARAAEGAEEPEAAGVPPSPYRILATRHLETQPVDAVSLCTPSGIAAELERIASMVRAGNAAESLPKLDGVAQTLGEDQFDEALTVAALRARAAADRDARRRARDTLRRLFEADGGGAEARLCARLEAARLDLWLRRYPEAGAQAARALVLAQAPAGETVGKNNREAKLVDAALFLQAEARYLGGLQDEADEIYRRLSHSKTARIAAAARLRVADVRFDQGERAEVLSDYETLLKRAAAFGASIEGWALRASEAAAAAGRYGVAAEWGERYLDEVQSLPARAVVKIRLADFSVREGEGQAGRKSLEEIAGDFGSGPIGWLADARQVDLEVDAPAPEDRLTKLSAARRAAERGLSLYAHGVLAHELRRLGHTDKTLAVLTRLFYDAAPQHLVPQYASDLAAVLDRSVAQLDEDRDCVLFVRRLGGRYGILAIHAASLDPFLRLGQCYETLGLPTVAMGVYRSLTRSSGGEIAKEVALPLARTALAAGDVGLVRTAAAGHVRRAGADRDRWMLLLAEAEVEQGKHERAARFARELVRSREPKGERGRALAAYARAIGRLPLSESDAETLAGALHDLPSAERARDPASYGEAALLSGELQRRLGRKQLARRFYREAAASLPEGSMRAQAVYWTATLEPRLEAASNTWQRAAGTESGGVWQRLAAVEVKLHRLRDQFSVWPVSSTRAGRR